MTRIERVAKAIYETWVAAGDTEASWAELLRMQEQEGYPTAKNIYALAIEQARAAIEAMREPTPAMVDAGVAYVLSNEPKDAGSWSAFVVMIHGQMTEAALNEQVAK